MEFLRHQAAYNPDQHRVASTASILSRYFGDKTLDDIRIRDIENMIASRRLAGAAPATINRARAFLSRLYNWSIDRGEFQGTNPVRRVKRFREVRSEPRILTPHEAGDLVRGADQKFKLAIALGLYTGGRRGELRALTPADFDEGRSLLRFRWRTTKGRKERFIPLPGPFAETLAAILERDPGRDFILEWRRSRLTGLRSGLERARTAAGLPWTTWITLRHTFAGWFLTNGGSMSRLQELLGHVNPLTTMVYRHFLPGHGSDVASFIGPPHKTSRDIEGEG